MRLADSQKLVYEFVKEYGYIIPARMGGKFYRPQGRPQGQFGSETTKRCRELRGLGLLEDDKEHNEGRMGAFKLRILKPLTPEESKAESQRFLQVSVL